MKSQLVRNNFSILIKYLLITCIVSLLIACDQSPQRQSIIFKITAIDINKQPVSKVKFYISGVDLMFGQTNKKGYYEDEYVATVGDVLEFRLEPPKGYTLINNINTLTVTEQEAPLEVFFTGEFNPPKHDYVFVVEGEEGDLVLVDNQNKLTLDKSKLAQFIHMGTPGSEFLIQVGEKSYQGKYSTNDEIYVITKSAQHTMVDDSIRLERAEIPKENDDTSGELDMPDLMVENETDQVEEKPENVTPRPKIKKKKRKKKYRPKKRKKIERDDPPAIEEHTDVNDPEPDFDPDIPDDPVDTQPKANTPSADDILKSLENKNKEEERRERARRKQQKKQEEERKRKEKEEEEERKRKEKQEEERKRKEKEEEEEERRRRQQPNNDDVSQMSQSQIKKRVARIEKSFDKTQRLNADEITFLKELNKSHKTSYNYAHRVLASFYFSLKKYKQQKNSLEIAVKKGRYKSNSIILLSLAQAYGRFRQYNKALPVLRKAEAKMRNIEARYKANIYRTYAEYLRLKYQGQRSTNPMGADSNLLDLAIQKWTRLKNMSSPNSRDAADARKKIEKLEQMKAEANSP